MSKVTEWFDGTIKPIRVGVYERNYSEVTDVAETAYSYWNGSFFSDGYETKKLAKNAAWYESHWQCISWRGLAKKP